MSKAAKGFFCGFLLSAALWIWIDAFVNATVDGQKNVPNLERKDIDLGWGPVVLSLVGMLLINVVDYDLIAGDEYAFDGGSTSVAKGTWRSSRFPSFRVLACQPSCCSSASAGWACLTLSLTDVLPSRVCRTDLLDVWLFRVFWCARVVHRGDGDKVRKGRSRGQLLGIGPMRVLLRHVHHLDVVSFLPARSELVLMDYPGRR